MTDSELPADSAAPAAPPATFEFLAHTLFTQALMALGRIPNPITRQSLVNMATARHFVDMLAMLEKKTAGNLTADEARMLEEIQHQLRMMVITGNSEAGPAEGSAS
jgi:hypothetical protein